MKHSIYVRYTVGLPLRPRYVPKTNWGSLERFAVVICATSTCIQREADVYDDTRMEYRELRAFPVPNDLDSMTLHTETCRRPV